jgi:DNA-binding transcriptional LysR family regulator
MSDLNEIQFFTYVAEAGSFSDASKNMDIPKSTLSRKVSELEARLGVTLLRRTTRQVKLTEIGAEYFKICKKALAELERAASIASHSAETIQGRLKIAAPLDIGITYLAEVAAEFVKDHPSIELEFMLNDQIINLIDEKVDLSVRAGFQEDSSLRAIKIGVSEFQLYASPDYLKKHGEPKTPKELENHRCIVFKNIHPDGIWILSSGGSRIKLKTPNKMSCDSLNMAMRLAIRGAGIALIPVFLGHEEVQKNQLSRVLKSWGTEREPVYAVYPDQPYVPLKTKLFLEYLKKAFH